MTVLNQADIGRGSTDIDADYISVTCRSAYEPRADDPGGGSGEGGVGRHLFNFASADYAAIRLHNQQRGFSTFALDTIRKLPDILGNCRHHINVEHGRDATLVFAKDTQNIGRE